jgi:hypothetical protein
MYPMFSIVLNSFIILLFMNRRAIYKLSAFKVSNIAIVFENI